MAWQVFMFRLGIALLCSIVDYRLHSHPIPLITSPLKGEECSQNPLPFRGRVRVGVGWVVTKEK
jgi:hypothetical protein